MKNIINVEMSCFWINKENPTVVSYNPENTSEYIPIQSSHYLMYELVKPKQDEIAYKYKNNDCFGYLYQFGSTDKNTCLSIQQNKNNYFYECEFKTILKELDLWDDGNDRTNFDISKFNQQQIDLLNSIRSEELQVFSHEFNLWERIIKYNLYKNE